MEQENRDHEEGAIPETAEEELASFGLIHEEEDTPSDLVIVSSTGETGAIKDARTPEPEAPPIAHNNPPEYFGEQQEMFVSVADSSSMDQFLINARTAWKIKHE